MTVAVRMRARFFARLRELAGTDTEEIEMPPNSTLADVYQALRGRHPSLPERGGVRGAINREFAEWGMHVANGDEVAFIPPVSGGA
jgi:molybdopterin converting factor subunit 1